MMSLPYARGQDWVCGSVTNGEAECVDSEGGIGGAGSV